MDDDGNPELSPLQALRTCFLILLACQIIAAIVGVLIFILGHLIGWLNIL